ncbi:hypothetical protein K0U07_06010 [bacterium]|nr:hypothetical protein [bacterium]
MQPVRAPIGNLYVQLDRMCISLMVEDKTVPSQLRLIDYVEIHLGKGARDYIREAVYSMLQRNGNRYFIDTMSLVLYPPGLSMYSRQIRGLTEVIVRLAEKSLKQIVRDYTSLEPLLELELARAHSW